MKKRIYYHDTDCGGIIYYANYLKYFEEARTECFEKAGFFVGEMADRKILFVVARQEIDYKSPATYGDELDVSASVTEMGRSKIVFDCMIKHQSGRVIASGKTYMVCVNEKIKPIPIPQEIKDKLLNA